MPENRESRNLVIKKIRKALIHKTSNRFAGVDWEKPVYRPLEDSLEESFARSFSRIGGQFVYCENELDFAEKLLNLTEQNHWSKFLCWEPRIIELLDRIEFPYSTQEQDFEDGIAGLTGCEA